VRTIDGEGDVVDTQYDAVGNVIATKGYDNKLVINPALPLAGQVPGPHPDDRLTQFQYDKVDRLVRRIDAEGFHTAYRYDAVGNRVEQTRFLDPVNFTDPLKRQVTGYEYDALNRLTIETSSLGVQTKHTYDLVGNRLSTTEAFGRPEARSWQYAYDDLNRATSETNPEGTVTRFVYDAVGQLRQKVEAAGLAEQRTTLNNYDANGRLTDRTNPDGTLTRYAYDALGNLKRQTDAADSPDSRATAYTYDRNSRLKTETIAADTPDAITRRHDYDAFGNRTTETVAPDTADARITRYEYDRVNHLVTQTDGNGIVTRFTYDTFGNVKRREITGQTLGLGGVPVTRTDATTFTYDGRDLLESETNAAGNLRTRQYDAVGNLRFETRGAGTAAASVTEYRYDLGNRLTEKLVDPQGLALRTQYEYDALNNLRAETDANGERSTSHYDVMNRVDQVTDALGFTTSFGYDRFGNQTSITTGQYFGTDPLKAAVAMPATTRFEYDAMNRTKSQTDALGVITKFDYDRRGNRKQKTEAFGTPDVRICTYRYDLVDRLVDETQPTGTVVHQAYNAAGELKSKTVDSGIGVQFKNATTLYAYDAGGRLASETDPVGSVTRYDYDSFGNRIRVTRGFGTTAQRATELVYDGAQRLIQELVDPTGLRLSTRYEYDARGNQTALVNANGQRGETVYDAGDRVVWQRDAEGDITRFIRDGRGNKKEEIHYATRGASLALGQVPVPNGLDRRVQFSYDANDRLTERIDARGVVNRLRYDAVGNVLENTQNATSLFGAGPRTTTYKYTLANLVREQVEPDGLKTTFDYDNVYNLKRKTAENRWIDTLNGNVERLELQVCEYQYDLNNRMIEEVTDPGGLSLRKTWRYDGLGDRIEEIDANRNSTRTWFDAAGRPTFTVDPLGHVKEARYDAVGNLVLAIQYFNPVSVSTLTDAVPPVVVPNAGNDRTVEYVYDKADRRTQTKLDPVRVFVGGMWVDGHRPTTTDAYDGVGNVVRQTDANGNTTYHYFDGNGLEKGTIDAEGFLTVNQYDPFGNKTFETVYFERQPLTAAQKETLDLRTYTPVGDSRTIEHAFDLGNNEYETRYPSADLFINGQNSTQAMRVNRTFDAFGQVLTETVMHAASDAAAAYKVMTYDAAGRITSEIDARAQELIRSDAPYFVELRGGKLAAQLTEAEKQAFRVQFTTTYAYDGENNLREKIESGRVTTFVYDRANRNTRVILPAVDTATVDAVGNIATAVGVRPIAEIGYDAAGNKTRELKADGTEILYRYDAANRQIAAVDQSNVYTEYGYDFSGNRTLMRRYFTPIANRAVLVPPAQHAADQLVQFDYDHAGRLIRERQEGDFATTEDNRVTSFGYDANGNTVETTDGRGFTSRLTYDGLNRVIEQQNPSGGITVTAYDALGKVAARQVGGWSAPTINGTGVTEALISNRGAIIAFTTDHPTSAIVHVRRVGDTGEFTTFGDANAREAVHAVRLSGLAADTLYEYQIVATDAFGFTLTTATRTFRTGVGVEAAVLSNLRQAAGSTTEFEADLHFALGTPVQGLVVAVGRAGGDVLSLANETLFTPVQQADGSYSVTLRFTDPATAFFQIRWSKAGQSFTTETSAVQQRQALRVFDGRLHAVSAGNGNFNLSVTWDLSAAFAANEIKSYIDPATLQTRYNVFVGMTLADGQQPAFIEALMPGNDGIFHADFNTIVDSPTRKLHFYYVMPDGSLVNAGPLSVPTLNGLDQRHQRIELSFPDLDTTGATLVFRYRLQGTTQWNTLPASAVSGLSVNVLGLTEGNYEYQADLTRGGIVLRTSAGTFKLREPGSVTNVIDAVGPNPVSFTVVDNLFSVAGLTPLGTGEALTLVVTDSHGVPTPYPFNNASFDLTVLSPGDYSFRIRKTRTTGTPPTVTTLNDITGNIHIAPLVLTAAAANTLSSERRLESFNRAERPPYVPTVTTTGTNTSADHIYSFYDDLGWRIFSNENGGIWTRYFFDGAGNVTKEVRFRVRDHSKPGNPFVDTIVDLDTPPTLAQLTQDYDAAVAAHNPAAGVDTIRVTEYTYDAANNKLSETTVSQAYGRVTDEYRYDRFNNKIREVTAKGLMANGQSIEQRTDYTYDSANRLTRTTIGPFQFFDSNGIGHYDTATTSIAYDIRGYKSTETSERGYVHRFRYDAQGRLVREWDAGKQDPATGAWSSMLRTDYVYDSFGRATQKTEFDLTPSPALASRTSTLEYSNFDQVTSYDFAGRITRMAYDQGGNKISETNARTFTERYGYDAENHLVTRIDRLGNGSFKSYDAYGHVISETDGNGRVTTYTIGAFGQVISKQTTLTRGIQLAGPTPIVTSSGSGLLARIIQVLQQQIAAASGGGRNVQEGVGSYAEHTAYDWLGRTTRVSDDFGKDIQSGYDDGDRLTSISDAAKSQTATFAYDARGLRTRETLAQGATVLRDQTDSYNSRGWLVGVDSGATVSFGGSTLSQPIHVFFRYDQAGNRVWVGDNKYVYDGDNRMLMGYDGKSNQVVQSIVYDGYGNRRSINTAGTIVDYTYTAQGEVLSGSDGEEWRYDDPLGNVGNATFHRAANGDSQTTTYDAENRALTVHSVSGGQAQDMTNFYDGAGNLALVRNSAADFGYDEVTFRDVRYDEQRKGVENSWVNNAVGLRGQTIFVRNANGELTFLDRGRKKDATENTVASFEYDNEDHIISRSDKPGAGTSASFFEGYARDPEVTEQVDEFGVVRNAEELARQAQLNGLASGVTHLQTFVYANGKPVAEASADHQLSLRKLTLQGGDPVLDAEGQVVGWTLALQASDIVRRADGSVDRAATAHNIAARAYLGYDALSAAGKARVDQYVQGQLPSLDSAIVAGARISVFGFIQLIDSIQQNVQVRTDYSVKQIGQDGMPSGQVASYVVRLNDTLQTIASIYYGSPSYWYLIAGANGLSGNERLSEGTTLSIPNVPANSVNNANTYKVYNEADIIGSTSPELVVIPKAPKKKKWYQKLVQVLIIIIVVVVAIWTAGILGPILGAALGAIGSAVGVAATIAAIGTALVTAAAVAALRRASSHKASRSLPDSRRSSTGKRQRAWARTSPSAPSPRASATGPPPRAPLQARRQATPPRPRSASPPRSGCNSSPTARWTTRPAS
jgi:YD repeat-containing protein